MYIDVLFVFNWVMDLLILIMASFVLRIRRGGGEGRRQWRRMCLAAALGAAGSCLLSVMQLVWRIAWIGTGAPALLAGIALAACMTAAAWPLPAAGALWRRILVVYANAFLIGGICSFLQVHMKTIPYTVLLLVSAAVSMAGREWLWRAQARNGILRKVRIACGGPVISVEGIVDTGNSLTLPGTTIPVAVVWKEAIWPAMTEKQREQYRCLRGTQPSPGKVLVGAGRMEAGSAADPACEKTVGGQDGKEGEETASVQEILSSGWRLVPYHSVGCSFGLLPALCVPHVYVQSEEGESHLEQVWMAVCEQPVSAQGKYAVLLYCE